MILISDAVDKKTKQASITSFPIVTSWSAGTTGLLPSGNNTGEVELKGLLKIEHGGTGIGNSADNPEREQTWLGTTDQGTLLYYDFETAGTYRSLAKIPATIDDVDKVLTLTQDKSNTLIPMWMDGGSSKEIEQQIKKLEQDITKQGFVLKYDNYRTKKRNPKYIHVKSLKSNSPYLINTYLDLRKKRKRLYSTVKKLESR